MDGTGESQLLFFLSYSLLSTLRFLCGGALIIVQLSKTCLFRLKMSISILLSDKILSSFLFVSVTIIFFYATETDSFASDFDFIC